MDIKSQGVIFESLNKLLELAQQQAQDLCRKSVLITNLDNIIYILILSLIIASTFCKTDILGCFAFLILFLTIVKLLTKKGEKLEMNLFEKFLFAYFLVVIISLAGSTLFAASFKGFTKTLTYLGFYVSSVHFYRRNTEKIPATIATIAICTGIQGFLGIIQNFAKVNAMSTWQDVSRINPEEIMTRVYGTLKPLNPNLYGGYMVAAIPTAIAGSFYYFLNKDYQLFFLFTAISVVSCLAVMLSGCRGAYLSLFFILILTAFFIGKYIWENNLEKIKKIYGIVLGALCTAVASAALVITTIRARIISMFVMREDSSTSFRFNVYQSSIQMIKDNWLLGIGIGNNNFREIYGLYMRTGFDALSTYSIYLELFVESGIFALIFFLLFLFYLIKFCIKIIFDKNNNEKTRIIALCSLMSISAIMIHGFVDTVFFRPQIQFIFWIMVAFISAKSMQKDC